MCQTLHLQLIIIDSLAGLVRFEYDNKSSIEMRERTALLFNLSRQLKWLSDIFHVAVVIINQVRPSSHAI
jgi:RecA/RadA recombinase